MEDFFCHNVAMNSTKNRKNTSKEKNNIDTPENVEGMLHFL
jgi:hypothetical protein